MGSGMVSPYLLRPLRSLEEVLSGARARTDSDPARRPQGERRNASGVGTARGVQEATPLWPRLVWTNTKRVSRGSKG